MRKYLFLTFFSCCFAMSMQAITLHVEMIDASEFTSTVDKIGKLVIDGTMLNFYDRQGELVYSADIQSVNVLKIDGRFVDVKNVFVSDRYVVYPNPTTSTLTVKDLDEATPLRLYSTDGRLIKSVVGTSMHVGDIPSGNYLLQCKNQIVKIIKN